MIDSKKYEEALQDALKNCKFISFTDEENIKIREELNEGMPEFLLAERKRQGETRLELKTIMLD